MRVYDEHVKAITHVPGWLENTGASGTDRVSGTSSAYALVPLIFRAVRLRCDAISSVPIHLYSLRGGTENIPGIGASFAACAAAQKRPGRLQPRWRI